MQCVKPRAILKSTILFIMALYMHAFFITVSPPILSIYGPLTMSVYAGSFITVNCTIQLSISVDSPVTVASVWKKDSIILTNSTSRVLLDAVLINRSLYLAQVVFSPFQLSSDDGVYACEVTINADDNDHVMSAGLLSNSITLRATGI